MRTDSRHLAAGVIAGIISRRDFLVRLGSEPERPDDLLKELQNMKFKPGQPIGVLEPSIRKLWSINATGIIEENSHIPDSE